MSRKTILNKKGQYYPQPSYSNIHPVLIIGIMFFIVPFLLPVIGISPGNFIKGFFNFGGVLLILVGGALSIFKASN